MEADKQINQPIKDNNLLSARRLRIFLCHSSGDKPAVRALYKRLQIDGLEPWLDEEDLMPGQDWAREIPKAVRSCDVVLVCLSNGSVNKEGYVQKEIRFALDVAEEKPDDTIFLIPVKLEECNVPERLTRWHWVNLYDERGYERLLRTLKKRASALNIKTPISLPDQNTPNNILSQSQQEVSLNKMQNAPAKVERSWKLPNQRVIPFGVLAILIVSISSLALITTLFTANGGNRDNTPTSKPTETVNVTKTLALATTIPATTIPATTIPATTIPATTVAAISPTVISTLNVTSGVVIPSGAGTEPEKKDLVMALVTFSQNDVIQTQADNIANFLSKETGYNITAKVLTSYAAVGEGMGAKNIDIAWVGPLDYVVAAKKFGVYAITGSIRNGLLGYSSLICVRSDSGISSLPGLKGKTIILGDELSPSSNLYPRYALIQAGLKPDTDVKVNKITNQSAIAVGVVEKAGDAGAFYSDARTNKEVTDKYPDIQTTTKVIYKSPLIPADPQIVRKDLNAGQVQKIYSAMIKLSNDIQGKQYLKDLFTIDGLATVKDSDYDGLREVINTVKPELLNS